MKEFTLTSEHLKLLRAAYVDWSGCEWGAPMIDCKRPYGNSGLIESIAEVLGEESLCPHCGESTVELDRDRYLKLHAETQTALQIVLRVGEFREGAYRADDYSENWKRV